MPLCNKQNTRIQDASGVVNYCKRAPPQTRPSGSPPNSRRNVRFNRHAILTFVAAVVLEITAAFELGVTAGGCGWRPPLVRPLLEGTPEKAHDGHDGVTAQQAWWREIAAWVVRCPVLLPCLGLAL